MIGGVGGKGYRNGTPWELCGVPWLGVRHFAHLQFTAKSFSILWHARFLVSGGAACLRHSPAAQRKKPYELECDALDNVIMWRARSLDYSLD